MIIWSYLTPFSPLTGNLSESGICQKTSQENQLHKEHDELRRARSEGARGTQENQLIPFREAHNTLKS